MTAFQSRPYSVLARLVDPMSGAGVAGLTYSALTVRYRKQTANAYVIKTLVAADLVDLGSGNYILRFSPAELSDIGLFVYQVTSGSTAPLVASFDVDPQPLALLAAPGVCVITGNIVDLSGSPVPAANIVFRAASQPAAIGPTLIAGGVLWTTPDAYGNFSVALLQGAVVLVEVGEIGLRQQFTVPYAPSASLISLLPPI